MFLRWFGLGTSSYLESSARACDLGSHCLMSGKVFMGVEGFASSTVFLLFLSCFLLFQEESKVDLAFQPVL